MKLSQLFENAEAEAEVIKPASRMHDYLQYVVEHPGCARSSPATAWGASPEGYPQIASPAAIDGKLARMGLVKIIQDGKEITFEPGLHGYWRTNKMGSGRCKVYPTDKTEPALEELSRGYLEKIFAMKPLNAGKMAEMLRSGQPLPGIREKKGHGRRSRPAGSTDTMPRIINAIKVGMPMHLAWFEKQLPEVFMPPMPISN